MPNMTEVSRIIKGLRRLGWTDTQIDDFLLYVEDGDETIFERFEACKENKEEKE